MSSDQHGEDLPKKLSGPQALMLDPMSISELKEYITWLEHEIERVNGEIEKKKGAQKAADSFFKKEA